MIRRAGRSLGASFWCSFRRYGSDLVATVELRPPPVRSRRAQGDRDRAQLQTQIHRVENLEQLEELITAELQHFDEHHAVSCLERLGSLDGRLSAENEDKLLAALLRRLDSGEMETSTLARLGAAAVSISLSDVVSVVSAKAVQQAAEFGNRDIAVLVRSMALAGQQAAVEALVNGAAPRAPGLGARALVRLTWASARVRWHSPVLDTVLEEASGRADRLQPQAMSNLLWSMASLRKRNKIALRSLLPHVVDRVRSLSPQGLATNLWALAALRPRVGTTVGTSAARPGWLEEDAVLRMSTQALRKIKAFAPEDLGALARATAVYASAQTRGSDFSPLAEAVVSEATRSPERLGSLSPRQLSRILGSMARWRCRELDSIEQLTDEVTRKADQLNTEQTAAIIWASCALQVSAKLVHALSTQTCRLFRERGGMMTTSDFGAVAGLLWGASLAAKPGMSTWPGLTEGSSGSHLNSNFLQMTKMEHVDLAVSEVQTYQLAGVAVAGARLRLEDCWLLRATMQEIQRRAETTSLEAQDCALAARGFVSLSLHSDALLGTLSHGFLQRVGRSFEGWDTGRDWSDMVEALLRAGLDFPSGSFEAELISAYEDSVVLPLLQHLEEVAHAKTSAKSARALKSLERFAASLGLPGLGSEQTRQVLKRAHLAEVTEISDPSWASARETAAERLWNSSAVHAAWLSYRISLHLDDFQLEEQEPGCLVAVAAGHSEQIPGFLRPLALPGVSAAGRHAEHQAVLSVFSLLLTAERRIRRQALAKASKDAEVQISGDVQIYAFGCTPCLSFLAALAQLKGHFPMIILKIGFDEDVARMPKLPHPFPSSPAPEV